MKKALFILTLSFMALALQAQDIYADYKLKEYPIQFRYPNDYQVQRAANMSYIVSNGVSEFYIKGYKVSNRFSADSLERMFMQTIYNDPSIVNLQMREKGRGSLGELPADRLVLEFIDKEKIYKVTAFMVYFHVNHEYNAILFFFDMVADKAISYEGLMVNMGKTLRWSDSIPYKNYVDKSTALTAVLPVFWRTSDISADSLKGFMIDDDRGRLTVQMKYTADSSTADKSAFRERDAIKLKPGKYVDQKFKATAERTTNKEPYGMLSGVYQENVNGIMRATIFKRIYYKRVVEGKLVEYIFTLEWPEYASDYYTPIETKIYDAISLPGTGYEPPKPVKK